MKQLSIRNCGGIRSNKLVWILCVVASPWNLVISHELSYNKAQWDNDYCLLVESNKGVALLLLFHLHPSKCWSKWMTRTLENHTTKACYCNWRLKALYNLYQNLVLLMWDSSLISCNWILTIDMEEQNCKIVWGAFPL